MTGKDLYTHLRDDGAGASLVAVLALVGAVVAVSTLVHLWHTRRPRRTPEQQALVNRLRESARQFPTDDEGLTTDLRRWR